MARNLKRIENIEEMLLWLYKSEKGDVAEYYRGFLYEDRQVRIPSNKERLKMADLAYRAYLSSKVSLVQKRNGDSDYSYMMQSLGLKSKVERNAE